MTHASANQSNPPESATLAVVAASGHSVALFGLESENGRAPAPVTADVRRLHLQTRNPQSAPYTGLGFWLPVLLVLLAEAVAILAFYGLEWSWLRQMHVAMLHPTLQALGCHVQTAGTLLNVNGYGFQISPDCTYVDLIICSLPLLWRIQRTFSRNLVVLTTFAAAVLLVNLARVLYGIYAFSHGVSLFWSHDIVDYVLWYPTMGVVSLLWLRSLFPRSSEREFAPSSSPECQSRLTSAATPLGKEATA